MNLTGTKAYKNGLYNDMTDPVPGQPFEGEPKLYCDSSDQRPLFFNLQTKATLDLFGNNSIRIDYRGDMDIPNRWVRFWSTVFFNSKWTLHTEEHQHD